MVTPCLYGSYTATGATKHVRILPGAVGNLFGRLITTTPGYDFLSALRQHYPVKGNENPMFFVAVWNTPNFDPRPTPAVFISKPRLITAHDIKACCRFLAHTAHSYGKRMRENSFYMRKPE